MSVQRNPEQDLYDQYRKQQRRRVVLIGGAIALFFIAFAVFALPKFLKEKPGDYEVEESEREQRWKPDEISAVAEKPLEMNDSLAARMAKADEVEEEKPAPKKRTGEPIDPDAGVKQAASFQGVFDPESEEGERYAAKAEQLLESWDTASTASELSELVVAPQRVVPLILDYRNRPGIQPTEFGDLLSRSFFKIRGTRYLVQTHRPATIESQPLFVGMREGEDGNLRIDWESLVGYCEMPWEQFVEQRVSTSTVFRCYAKAADYYNFEFGNKSEYQSFALADRQAENVFYGFARRDGDVYKELVKALENRSPSPVILKLAFVEGSKMGRCVEILDFVQETWILESGKN